ncbi:MAG: hypothetical protein AAF526_11070 [Pseudomonadota bacterium]
MSAGTTFYVQRRGHTLVPAQPSDALAMEDLPVMQAIRVTARKPRNAKHHRLIWGLYAYTAKALNDGPETSGHDWKAEDVSELVKFQTGHVQMIKLPPDAADRYGTEFGFRADSISYDKMDEIAFADFARRAVQYIQTDLCPWLMNSEHAAKVQEIIDHYDGRARAAEEQSRATTPQPQETTQ